MLSRVLLVGALLVTLAVAQEPWRQSGTVYADRNPVVLVPGFGGTVMVGREHGDSKWVRSWFPLSYTPFPGLYTSRFERFMKGTYHEDIGMYRQHCYKDNAVNPNGDYFYSGIPYPRPDGLYAVEDILPNVWIPFVSSDKYYEETIKTFKQAGYVAGVTLYGFPYDWRQSSFYHVSDLFAERVQYIVERTGKAVDVVSHSNGCLVTRNAMFRHNLDEDGSIRRWVAQGGPWQGATKTYAVAAVGDVGIPFIGKEARDALIQAPGFYDLMPNPLWNWEDKPEMRYTIAGDSSYLEDDDSENWDAWQSILQNHQFVLPDNPSGCGSSTKTISPSAQLKSESDAAWAEIDGWEMSSKVEFYNVFGNARGGTIRGIDWTEEAVNSMTELKDSDYEFLYGDGDNTVPLESLDNPSFATSGYTRYMYPDVDHSKMLRNRRLVSTVVHLISRPSTTEVFLTGGAATLVVLGAAGGAYTYRRRRASSEASDGAAGPDLSGAKFISKGGSQGSRGSKRAAPGSGASQGSRGSKRAGSQGSRGSKRAGSSRGSKRGSRGSRGSVKRTEGGAPADIVL